MQSDSESDEKIILSDVKKENEQLKKKVDLLKDQIIRLWTVKWDGYFEDYELELENFLLKEEVEFLQRERDCLAQEQWICPDH